MADQEDLIARFSFPAEILPDNDRTTEILKKRAEIEE